MMLAWGMGLMLPGDSMSLPQYRLLKELAPEPVWAAWSLGIGGLRFIALYINGHWRKTPLIRMSCAILGMVWWVILGFLFINAAEPGRPFTAGLLWFPVFILFEGYSAIRSAGDAYHSGALRAWQRAR